MDALSEERLTAVHPKLAEKIRQMAATLAQEGITLLVTQGLRSWNQQAKLYAQGRTAPGKTVTNAPPGHSYHQFGLAVDLAPLEANGAVDWNAEHPSWKRLVAVGESVGLTEGANFRTFPDMPHFQLTGRFPISPDDEVRSLFLQAGMVALWHESGIA